MHVEGWPGPLLARLTRPGVATPLALAAVILTLAAELSWSSEASFEIVHVLAVAWVAWSATRFRHYGSFALLVSAAHAATQSFAWRAGLLALAWNIAAHAVCFVGTAVLVARTRRNMVLLARLASTDDLTGASSRRYFLGVLERELGLAHAMGRPHGVAMIDLDRFAEVNNYHGHERGDEVLASCARAIQDAAGEGCLVGRIGGDEFAVLLRADDDEARRTADRIRLAVLRAAEALGLADVLSVSIGVATCHLRGPPAPFRLLSRADQLMYEAKRSGGDAVAFEAVERVDVGLRSATAAVRGTRALPRLPPELWRARGPWHDG